MRTRRTPTTIRMPLSHSPLPSRGPLLHHRSSLGRARVDGWQRQPQWARPKRPRRSHRHVRRGGVESTVTLTKTPVDQDATSASGPTACPCGFDHNSTNSLRSGAPRRLLQFGGRPTPRGGPVVLSWPLSACSDISTMRVRYSCQKATTACPTERVVARGSPRKPSQNGLGTQSAPWPVSYPTEPRWPFSGNSLIWHLLSISE